MVKFILVLLGGGGGGRSWGFVGKSIREARAIISQEKKISWKIKMAFQGFVCFILSLSTPGGLELK